MDIQSMGSGYLVPCGDFSLPPRGDKIQMTLSKSTPVALQIIPFEGTTLEAVKVDETVWVSVRRMCDALGIDEEAQRQKLTNRERTPWATTFVTKAVADDGKLRDVFCLDLDSVPMWLATIDTSRVAEHVRPKIIVYQREAAKVLRAWFFGEAKPTAQLSRTEIARMLLEECERTERLEEANRLLLQQNEKLDAEATFARDVQESTNTVTITSVAKLLGYGPQRFFARLRADGILALGAGGLPLQRYLEAGYFEVKEGVHETKNHGTQTHYTIRVTGKGQTFLHKRYGKAPLPADGMHLEEV